MEVIHMYFNSKQIKKLKDGKTVQLKTENMISKDHGELVELHMSKKYCNQIRMAIKNGKSYRFNTNKFEMFSKGVNLSSNDLQHQNDSSNVKPIKKGKVTKGSSEAKEKMEMLRSMKKKTSKVIEGLGMKLPSFDNNIAPLSSALKQNYQKLIYGKGAKNVSNKDNGSENGTLLNRCTPRIKSDVK